MPQVKRSTPAKSTGSIVAEFEQDRETKNAFRFAEVTDADRGAIGTIYVTKSALEKAGLDPEGALEVTVRQADED